MEEQLDIFKKFKSLAECHQACLVEWVRNDQWKCFFNMGRIYFENFPQPEIRKLYDFIKGQARSPSGGYGTIKRAQTFLGAVYLAAAVIWLN